MIKRFSVTAIVTLITVSGVLVLSACSKPANTLYEPEKQQIEDSAGEIPQIIEVEEQAPVEEQTTDEEQGVTDEPEEEFADTEPTQETATPEPEEAGGVLKKVAGGADEVGIYSVVIKLNENAADKGVIEMVYNGAKGTPQENSVVNTFRAEYYKQSDGTFEISTFFNGEIYQNQHNAYEVKIVNTFDATLRAGDVVVTYTPDGGETQEVFKADADYFR